MKLKEIKLGKFKAFLIYAITKDGQRMQFVLSEAEQVFIRKTTRWSN